VELINPSALPAVVKGYSHGVAAGDFVFVAGQLSLDEEGELVGDGEIEAQTTQVFENIKTVLSEVGLGLGDVVSVTVYIRDFAHYDGYSRAYRAAFGDHAPARATVQCELVVPGALVEAQAVAVRRG
jgi:2-iminobutanoate/2-iminopropanoate deaminase